MTLLQEIGRKLIHLSSLWMVVFIHMFEKETSILFFGALFVLFFICEYLRMTQPFVISLTNRYFKNIMRAHESVTRFDLRALTRRYCRYSYHDRFGHTCRHYRQAFWAHSYLGQNA